MIKLVDLTFHVNTEYTDTGELYEAQKTSFGYTKFLDKDISVRVVKHWHKKTAATIDGIDFSFFKGNPGFFNIPFATLFFLHKYRPDVIIVQGFGSPFQLWILKYVWRSRAKIIVQHHGDKPYHFPKGILQRYCANAMDACFFTAMGNADEWMAKKMIPSGKKCYEVLEASTFITKKEKEAHRVVTVFLWVGRLNNNKDPLTVVKAFAEYSKRDATAHLYMIYQTEELLPAVNDIVEADEHLTGFVHMVGKVPYSQMADWYSAADIYLSASYNEGSGYALIEAMSCGCIPVVTNIPSFRKITANGRAGYLYEPGNVKELVTSIEKVMGTDKNAFSGVVTEHFKNALSFESIGKAISKIVKERI